MEKVCNISLLSVIGSTIFMTKLKVYIADKLIVEKSPSNSSYPNYVPVIMAMLKC
jgi:hypothetical protein